MFRDFAGGRPAAGHFFLLRQRKSNPKEGDPNPPSLTGFPALLDWSGFLINLHDPLRGHVLKHTRQNSLTRLRYSVAEQGKEKQKSKTTARALRAHPWLGLANAALRSTWQDE